MASRTYLSNHLQTQNDLLLQNLLEFYKEDRARLTRMMNIINGESRISLRVVDWFVTNFAKKFYTWYELPIRIGETETERFKVYNDYKLKLKAYSKSRFDPFCRWERTMIPYDDDNLMETTIGQLNFFKWAIQHGILDYIDAHFDEIETDMNERNSISRRRHLVEGEGEGEGEEEEEEVLTLVATNGKTRKKREELSVSACKCIMKESVKIIVKFN